MSVQKVSTKEYRPMQGVTLKDGVFKDLFTSNQQYLMRHYTLNDLLGNGARISTVPTSRRASSHPVCGWCGAVRLRI